MPPTNKSKRNDYGKESEKNQDEQGNQVGGGQSQCRRHRCII
ncbi:hypothetical protein EZS27_035176, partial [termite gut metagenome]